MACGTALLLAACARTASQSASVTSDAPAMTQSVNGTASAKPAANVEPTASTPPAKASPPASTPVVAAAAPPTAASAGPQIYSLVASTTMVHAGQSVSFSASTTPDIESVTANVSAYTLPFTRRSAGRFVLAFAIPPNVPGLFHGTYALDVTARSTAGTSVHRSISITFQ